MRITPIEITSDDATTLTDQIKRQDLSTGVKQSLDPDFPMWKYTTLHKHLLYFPMVDTAHFDNELHFLADRTKTVGVKLNSSSYFTPLRNTEGIETLVDKGISGESPLQQLSTKYYELFTLMRKRMYAEYGIDPSHKVDMQNSNDPAVDIIKKISDQLPVESQKEYVVCPILSIKLEQKDGIHPEVSADGKMVTETGWLKLTKSTYDKLVKSVSNLEEQKVGGEFFIFDYTSNSIKKDNPNARMLCANSMQISHAPNASLKELAPKLDEKMKDWTLQKLWNTVTMCSFIPDKQLYEMTSSIDEDLTRRIETEKNLLNVDSSANEENGQSENAKGIEQPKKESTMDALSTFGSETVDVEKIEL